jgi:hypothetical protein
MVGTNHAADGRTGEIETCPERPNEPGPDGHGVEMIEQPDDMDVFWVSRCMWCGKIMESYDTEQEYLKNEFPEIHGDN